MKRMAHLHNHTDEGSNLRMIDCITKVEPLIDKAVELGDVGLAITDHESLCAHVHALQYVKSGKENGTIPEDFKLILGDECYLIDDIQEWYDDEQQRVRYSASPPFYHFILLAKDKKGHEQLRRISTTAWLQMFSSGFMERVPITKQQLKDIIGEDKGHLIATTACIGGELGNCLLKMRDGCTELPFADEEYDKKCKQKAKEQMESFIDYCLELFGKDFYFEMQPNDDSDQTYVNEQIIKLSKQYNIPFIVTTDTHYLDKKSAGYHKAYLNSKEEEREVDAFYKTTYMMDIKEIHDYMDVNIGESNVSKALRNTCVISDMIEEYDLYHTQVVPKEPLTDDMFQLDHIFQAFYEEYPYLKKFAYSEEIYDRYYLYLVENGWWDKEYREDLTHEEKITMVSRINDELEAIWESSRKIKDNIASYYITALSIVEMMWADDGGNSLVGCSRGSIAAFYTAYLIGLQQINPLLYDIPYWRHLHASRPEMPDVDIDSEANKRNQIIDATKRKYGEDRVLNICTFKTEGSKSAIITAGRAIGLDPDTTHYLSNMIPVVRGATTSLKVMIYGDEENSIKPNTEFITECNKYTSEFGSLLEIAQQIEGLVCGRSVHASGVIIFDDEYTKYNAAMRTPSGQLVTQWDMNDSTYCGGLKYDYLTISNLDSMRVCMNLLLEYGKIEWQGSLKATYNKYFHPDVLDYKSPEMWRMAKDGEIVNLFQFMTSVGLQAIKKIAPQNLTELGVANAVMRLMPPEGREEQPLDQYVRYKNDITQWYNLMHSYDLSDEEIEVLEKHLKTVHGVATMQEEIMKLVMDEKISDLDMVGANKIRKSIAKKKKKLQEEAKKMFYEGGRLIGTSENLLDYVWKECVSLQLG